MKVLISYPDKDQEKEIISRMTEGKEQKTKRILSTKELLELQRFVPQIYADDRIKEYVTQLVDATRHPEKHKLELNGFIAYGASPRASIWLILGAKAYALMNGRGYVIPEDVKAIAHDVLRHRIITTYEADAEGMTSDMLIDKILESVKIP
jgi:MoxR-like ATPase